MSETGPSLEEMRSQSKDLAASDDNVPPVSQINEEGEAVSLIKPEGFSYEG